jgi:hypothetical protein
MWRRCLSARWSGLSCTASDGPRAGGPGCPPESMRPRGNSILKFLPAFRPSQSQPTAVPKPSLPVPTVACGRGRPETRTDQSGKLRLAQDIHLLHPRDQDGQRRHRAALAAASHKLPGRGLGAQPARVCDRQQNHRHHRAKQERHEPCTAGRDGTLGALGPGRLQVEPNAAGNFAARALSLRGRGTIWSGASLGCTLSGRQLPLAAGLASSSTTTDILKAHRGKCASISSSGARRPRPPTGRRPEPRRLSCGCRTLSPCVDVAALNGSACGTRLMTAASPAARRYRWPRVSAPGPSRTTRPPVHGPGARAGSAPGWVRHRG